MSPADKNVKDRLLQAARALLDEVGDPAQITVRDIADRAGAGVGSINYHFQSKEALLNEAVSAVLMEEAAKWFAASSDPALDPLTRLRQLFKETARISVQYPQMMQYMLAYGFQTGEWSVPTMILPLLREIFGDKKDELALRMLALQIVLPLQAIGMHPANFRQYAGLDLNHDRQRDQAIDLLIDNLITL